MTADERLENLERELARAKHLRAIRKSDAAAVARLHHVGIYTGFLSSLGRGFLVQLYAAISSCPAGFGYAWEEPAGQVVAFVACAESVGRLYREALLRRSVPMGLSVLARAIVRPSVVWRAIETLRYPGEVGKELPPAEILSIVVGEAARRRGVGQSLMRAALKEFKRRDICHVKVAVGADNEPANRFYQRCGFHLALTREHHGLPLKIYVIDLAETA